MTPLLGTKNPSAPVGDKSGGDRRASRSLLSCAWWSGMGRLWRGMGGMGRPEPLSAHRPRRQQRLSGFHETRNTRHETRLFFETRPFCRVGRPLMREGGRPAGFKGGCTKRCVNEWKEVYLNPETKITTFSESRLGSRPGISHNIPLCVGKIRISPCRQSSASEHCGNRDIGFMDVSSRRLTFPGPQVSPSGEAKGQRVKNRESRPFTKRAAQAGPSSELFTKHETRITAFFESRPLWPFGSPWVREGWRHRKPPFRPLPPPPSRCFPVHHCSPLFTIVRHCSPKKILSCASVPSPSTPATRTARVSRITKHESRVTAFMLFTRHETRNTAFFRRRRARDAQSGTPARTAAPRRPAAAFLRVVARHRAAMARHGRPPSPAQATRPVGFSPATRHATWFFPVPPATPRRATPSPANGFFTNHETRITNHGLSCRRETGFCRVITYFCLLIATFYRIITSQKLAIRRNASECVGMIRITPEPLSALRPPQLPPPSGLVPLRRKKNEPC